MRASCVSIFSTVFIFSSVSADVAGFVYVGVVVVAAMAAGLVSGPVRMAERRSSRLRRFFAAFHQMSSIFGAREINRKKKVSSWERVRWEIGAVLVLGYGVLWYSGALVLGWVLMQVTGQRLVDDSF
jgi:hypothetical protein